jgi:hemerythrin superfamily protein
VDAARRMASDHEVVEDLLTRLSGSSTSDGRGELADEFARRLRAHVRAADELLVPVLRQRATGGDLARLDEVDAVDTRLTGELERLARTGPSDPGFDEQIGRVRQELTRHMDLEESVVLPRTEDLLSDDELIELGARIERRQKALLRGPRLGARLAVPRPESLPFDPVRLARTVGIIVAAGVLLAVWGRLRPRMRTSGPLPPRR